MIDCNSYTDKKAEKRMERQWLVVSPAKEMVYCLALRFFPPVGVSIWLPTENKAIIGSTGL